MNNNNFCVQLTGRPCLFHWKKSFILVQNIVTSDRQMQIAKLEICHANGHRPKIITHHRKTIIYVILGPFRMLFPAPTIFHICEFYHHLFSHLHFIENVIFSQRTNFPPYFLVTGNAFDKINHLSPIFHKKIQSDFGKSA